MILTVHIRQICHKSYNTPIYVRGDFSPGLLRQYISRLAYATLETNPLSEWLLRL